MSWHEVLRDGARLRGFDGGEGPPVIFQHGLGGDEAQVAEVFPAAGFRRLTLECRGQGQSDAGDITGFSIAGFADDVLAFAGERGVKRFAIGGISMGAALALRIAVKMPEQVTALVLARPAWLWQRAPRNMQVFVELAHFLRHGSREDFAASATARRFAKEAPDNLASLLKFFDRPDPVLTAQLLTAIASDGLGVSEDDVRSIQLPTLVIGNGIDLVHPLSHARKLAAVIPGSRFVEVTPTASDRPRHAEELRAALFEFLKHEGIQT